MDELDGFATRVKQKMNTGDKILEWIWGTSLQIMLSESKGSVFETQGPSFEVFRATGRMGVYCSLS